MYHYGFTDKTRIKDPFVMNVIVAIENHFRNYFSQEATMIRYLESVIRHQRASMGIKD